MKNIKIEVIENGVLETTVKIPLVVLKIAKHLIPKKYIARLEENSIDINLIPTANIGQLTNIQFLLQTAQG